MDNTSPQSGDGVQPAPAMDIVPGKPPEAPQIPRPDAPASPPAPRDAAANALPVASNSKPAKLVTIKPPKAPGSGAGLAIFATVVIVLGLGALIVYAYLRSNGISPY